MKVDPLLKRNRSYASSHEVWKFIAELGISKVTQNSLFLIVGVGRWNKEYMGTEDKFSKKSGGIVMIKGHQKKYSSLSKQEFGKEG